MWFLHNRVILTKDNLKKRNWQVCSKCCFCDQGATIKDQFITCSFAKIFWRILHMVCNIHSLTNITKLFRNWLNWLGKREASHSFEYVDVLYFGPYDMYEINLSYESKIFLIRAG
jgi:hypothetical protein